MYSYRDGEIKGLIGHKNISQLVCLTLYNEEAESLAGTLLSLAKNVNGLPSWPRTVVSIIADGKNRVSPSSKLLLEKLGLISHIPQDVEGDLVDCVSVTLPASTIVKTCGADNADIDYSKKLTLILCTKNNNCGKLDSHWWFFKKIAPFFEPDFCFQIDAGTILNDDAIVNMRAKFDDQPSTGALASNVLIRSKTPTNILESFQVGDFAVQKTIVWPSEAMLGYLSVVPGQFCGFRYSALSKPSLREGVSPIDRYLRGMDCDSAFEKTMFLAEDRVMGFEILAHEGSDNRLGYCETSICYTDECDDIKEFLGQRRRWVNSAFMCRTWMMGNMGRYFRDSSSSLCRKLHTCLSLTNMIANHALEWFQPLIHAVILFITFISIDKLGTHYGVSEHISITAFAIIALLWLAPTILALSNFLHGMKRAGVNLLFGLVGAAVVLVMLANVFASVLNGDTSPWSSPALVYIGGFSFCICLGAFFLEKQTCQELFRGFFQYVLMSGPLGLMMFSYAFVNIDDSSWGTKGLRRRVDTANSKEMLLNTKLKKFRVNFVASWLIANIVGFALAIHYQWVYSLLMVVVCLSLFIAVTGLLGVAHSSVRSWLGDFHQGVFKKH